MAKEDVVLFIAGFLRRMRGKYKALSYFFNIPVEFLVEIKSSRKTVSFIQMINFRFEADLVEQFGTTHSQEDELRHLGSNVGIIKAMRDGLRDIIVFRNISGHQ